MKKNYSLLTTFLASNLLILMIPFTITIIIYIFSTVLMEEQFRKDQLSLLTHNAELVDSQLNDIRSLGEQIAVQSNISPLLNKHHRYTSRELQMDFYYAKETFKEIKTTHNLIMDFYLFLDRVDTVITCQGIYKTPFFMANFNDSAVDLMETYQQGAHYYVCTSPSDFMKSENRLDTLIYALTLPLGNRKEIESTLFILMKRDKLEDLLQPSTLHPKSLIYVMDTEQNILLQLNGLDCTVTPEDIHLKDHDSGDTLKINNEKYLISYTQSPIHQWTYVSLIPDRTISENLSFYSLITLTITIVCLLLGFIVSYVLANKNSKPVREIINLVNTSKGNYAESNNAYSTIYNAMEKLINNHEELTEKLDNHKPVLQNNFLRQLLHGKIYTEEELYTYSNYTELNLNHKNYMVIAINIKGYDHFIDTKVLKELSMARVVLLNHLNENISTPFYTYDIDHLNIALLLCFDESNSSDFVKLKQDIQLIISDLRASYFIHTSFAMGIPVDNPLSIHTSYNQAMKALHYLQYQHEENILYYEDLPYDADNLYYPYDLEQELIMALKTGDQKKLKALLKIIFNENFVIRNLSQDKTDQLISVMKGTLYREIEGLMKTQEVHQLLQDMDSAQSVDIMFNYIIRIHTSISESVSKKNENDKITLLKDIVSYVDDHYHDSGLTLFDVATQFGLSETCMYNFFRDNLGITYASYLEQLRIKEACRLITLNQNTFREITYLVGYNNDNTFRRAFKRIMGCTPTVYKESL